MTNDDLEFGQTIRGFVEKQKVFGRFTLRRILGRGGMGVVWLAWDETLEENVALKFMPEMVRTDEVAIDELKRETRKGRKLTHPHITRIFDFFEDGQTASIAMEYIDGATLSAMRLQQADRVFLPSQLHGLLNQLGAALTYAHETEQVVHRDLKPANLMVNSRGQLKVTDFGISSSVTESVSRMSVRTGTSGSPPYMSPQQVLGEPSKVSDDVYSFGATVYELLAGKPPFYKGNIYAQIREVVPPPMAQRRAEVLDESDGLEPIPPHWEETIASCLAKDPAQRPRSIAETVEALLAPNPMPKAKEIRRAFPPEKAMREESPAFPPPPPRGKHSRTKLLLIVSVALIVLASLGAGYWFGIYEPRANAREKHQKEAQEADRELSEKQRIATDQQERIKAEAEKQAKELAEKQRQAEADAARIKAETEKTKADAEKQRLALETEANRVKADAEKASADAGRPKNELDDTPVGFMPQQRPPTLSEQANPVTTQAQQSGEISSSPEMQNALLSANLNGEFMGKYTYGNSYGAQMAGKSVDFHIEIAQQNEASTFRGVIDEPYSGFGVPKGNRLWADVRGEVIKKGAASKIHFIKTYRYFSQPSVVYQGNYNPLTKQIEGDWIISNTKNGGSFKMRQKL